MTGGRFSAVKGRERCQRTASNPPSGIPPESLHRSFTATQPPHARQCCSATGGKEEKGGRVLPVNGLGGGRGTSPILARLLGSANRSRRLSTGPKRSSWSSAASQHGNDAPNRTSSGCDDGLKCGYGRTGALKAVESLMSRRICRPSNRKAALRDPPSPSITTRDRCPAGRTDPRPSEARAHPAAALPVGGAPGEVVHRAVRAS
jgi:hypothetical protein